MAESGAAHTDEVVSFESEELILVDADDRDVGSLSKEACHDGDGILHRAFSLFVFNDAGELLLQRRSDQKRLWPGYWSNSCCSHPRRGESMEVATRRRLYEELGQRCELDYLYKFIYQAPYGDVGSEHELCWVYVGRSADPVRVNRNEISEWRYVKPGHLDAELEASPERFTPWFKMEWRKIREEFGNCLPGAGPAAS